VREGPDQARAAAQAAAREPLRVLFVEDRPSDVELCLIELRRAGFDVTCDTVDTREQFVAKLRTRRYDVILSDYGLPGWTGMDALDDMHRLGRHLPFIVVTGSLGDEAAVDCVKRGAVDYVIKDRLARLPVAVRQALEREKLRNSEAAAIGALEASEERYRSLVENSPDAILLIRDGRWTFANQGAARLLGAASPGDLVGRSIFDFVEPSQRGEVRQRLARIDAIDAPDTAMERRLVRLDGTVVDVDVVQIPAHQDPGSGGQIVFRDITARKRMEDALREREERFRQITENIREAFYMVKADLSELLYVSPAYEEIVGRRREEVYRDLRVFFSAIHPDDLSQVMADIASVRAGAEVAAREFRVVRPDGEARWVLGRTVPVRNARGEVYRLAGVALDITERKRAEEALRETNEYLEGLFNYANAPIIVWDAQYRITRFNHAFEVLTGRSAADVIGQPLEILFPPALVKRSMDLIGKTLTGEHWVTVEIPIDQIGGCVRTVLWNSATLFSSDGKTPVATIAQGQDITERKHAEETLRQEQFLVNTLMENIPDSIYFKDAESRFVRIGRAMAQRFGLSSPAEAVGRTDFDFFSEKHARSAFETEQGIIRTGQPVVDLEEIETWPNRPNAWVSSTKMPLRDAAGCIVGTFGISRDITRRKAAEEALRRSEAEHRGMVEYAPLGIYQSNPDGRFLTVNRALVAMLGYASAEELLPLSIPGDVYAVPEERERLVAQFAARDNAQTETQWKRKDGTLVTVRLNVRLVRYSSGQIECFEGLVEDVTEQRSLENQFRQAQRLEAVGRLAGGVAHDFNNVLTAITGYSELLLEGIAPGDPKRQDVQEIRVAAQRAASLTRQLLAFSRKQVLQPRVLDLNAVVQGVEKMLQRLIGEDVTLQISTAPALGAVRADPGQIEQVIMNLAVNARDAMPGGGRLTLETGNVELDGAYARDHAGAGPGQYVMLAVSDTGVGMDAETRSHAFEPFFTTKEQGKGTGLGLSTVYGIVKQSGGYVWVYSEPGRGATFKIYLPRVDAQVEAAQRNTAEYPVAGGSESILLVEDDAAVREIVTTVLAQQGYRVLRAPDGRAALELAHAERGRVHLLITDVVMPGLSGRELAEALVRERPGIKVLFMSGYTDDAVVRHGVLQEGVQYLQKPFTPDALVRKVRKVLDMPAALPAPAGGR